MTRPFCAAGLAGALILAAWPASGAEYLVQPISVTVMKSVFGQVQSKDLIPARARIGGTVKDLAVAAGDQVRAGQPIAHVIDEKLTLQLEALDARRMAVVAQLDNASTNLERAKQLFGRGTIPKSRLDELQTQFDVITNQLSALEAERAVNIQQSEEGTVVAPADGRVLSVPVTADSVILPGEPVAQIAGGGYFLRLRLPERHADNLAEGGTVTVGTRGLSSDNTKETLTGRLAKVYPEIENGRVIADVEVEGLGQFFVGERTLVTVPIGKREILAVPPATLTTRHGIDFVTLAGAEGGYEVAVVPGDTFDTDDGPRVEILTGLKSGDSVIVP